MRFSSDLSVLYNRYDDKGKGRCVMLLSMVVTNIISWLTGGMFYTSFLLANGINLVNIGIITFVPFIANCFAVFSPFILEHFKKRRWVLAISRAAYYTLNILAVTVLPPLIPDPNARVAVFVALIFAANIVNALFTSGYSVWHVNFIPEQVRPGYFTTATTISNFVGIGTALLSSLVADALAKSPYANTVIVILRYLAFALAIGEVAALASPKEYPYPQSGQPKITDIFVKPFRHKKFMFTMLIVFLYTVGTNIPAAAIYAYLLQDVGVTYTFIQVLNFFYPVALLIFSRVGQNNIRRLGWFRTFAVYTLLQAPTTVAYACVNSSNVWILLPIVRLTQHYLGVNANVAFQNMAFVNLPQKDQTNYIAFFTLVSNLGAFFGMLMGTSFISAFPTLSWRMMGMEFCNVQVLMLMWAASQVIVPVLTLSWNKRLKLEPEGQTA